MGGALKIKKEFKKDVQMFEQAPSPFLAMQQKSEEISKSNLSQENMDLRLAVLTAAFNSFVETPNGKNAVRDYLNESAAHFSASLSNIQDQLAEQPQEIMSKYYTHAKDELPQIQNNINRTTEFIKAVKKGLKKRMNNPKELQEYIERAMPMVDQKIRECHEDNAKLVGQADYTQKITKLVGGTAVTITAAFVFPLAVSGMASSVVGGAAMGAGVDLVVAATANAVTKGKLELTKKDFCLAVAIGGTIGAFANALKFYKVYKAIKTGKSLVKFSNQEIKTVTGQLVLFKKMAPTLERIKKVQAKLPEVIAELNASSPRYGRAATTFLKGAKTIAKFAAKRADQMHTSAGSVKGSLKNRSEVDYGALNVDEVAKRQRPGGSG